MTALSSPLDRRRALGLAVAGSALLAAGRAAAITIVTPPPATITLTVGDRAMTVHLRVPERWRGVALFGHGMGADPAAYEALFARLVAAGWVVMAPVHVDSHVHPDRERYDRQASFGARLADLKALSAHAAEKLAPGLPQVVVGHSYGSLLGAVAGGALGYLGPMRIPEVRAVLAFSDAGKVPGLVQPSAYASLAVPLLTVTGTADVVPAFAPDWHDHLFAAQTSAAPARALVLDGVGHDDLAREPALARSWPAAEVFLSATGLGDGDAARAYADWRPAAPDTLIEGKSA